MRYISPYLIQYVPVKAKKISAAGKHAPGARVLTSDECTQILVEREEKKELAEKAQRKAERERKKQEKEVAVREKAEKCREVSRLRAEKKAELLASKTRSQRSRRTIRCNDEEDEQHSSSTEPLLSEIPGEILRLHQSSFLKI